MLENDGGWTEQRIELLKRLWADGPSASQIAGELGGVSRNAVIAKAHRLGLHHLHPRPQQPRRPKPPRAPRRPRVPLRLVRPEPLPEETQPFEMPIEQRCDVLGLTSTKCHWPVGDPRLAGFYFCGGTPWHAGASYCAYHTRLSLNATAPRPATPAIQPQKPSAWSLRR